MVWIQSFPSPRLAAEPRVKNPHMESNALELSTNKYIASIFFTRIPSIIIAQWKGIVEYADNISTEG